MELPVTSQMNVLIAGNKVCKYFQCSLQLSKLGHMQNDKEEAAEFLIKSGNISYVSLMRQYFVHIKEEK